MQMNYCHSVYFKLLACFSVLVLNLISLEVITEFSFERHLNWAFLFIFSMHGFHGMLFTLPNFFRVRNVNFGKLYLFSVLLRNCLRFLWYDFVCCFSDFFAFWLLTALLRRVLILETALSCISSRIILVKSVKSIGSNLPAVTTRLGPGWGYA